jgi:hypothetical protein
MVILLMLLALVSVPFDLVAFLLWRWRPDAGRAFLIAGAVAAVTSLGVFVVTLGVIDRMHTWDVSMGDYWNSAFFALLSMPPVMVIVGTGAYRRLQRNRRAVLASGSGLH